MRIVRISEMNENQGENEDENKNNMEIEDEKMAFKLRIGMRVMMRKE